jgi:hypothetical protein
MSGDQIGALLVWLQTLPCSCSESEVKAKRDPFMRGLAFPFAVAQSGPQASSAVGIPVLPRGITRIPLFKGGMIVVLFDRRAAAGFQNHDW